MRQVTRDESELWQNYINNLKSIPVMPGYRPFGNLKYKIDLHHMTVQQAFLASRDFIHQHYQQGSHYVTVITGRSGQIADEWLKWCQNWPCIAKTIPLDGDSDTAGSWRVEFVKRSA